MGIPMPLFERYAKGTEWKLQVTGLEVAVVEEPVELADEMWIRVVPIRPRRDPEMFVPLDWLHPVAGQ